MRDGRGNWGGVGGGGRGIVIVCRVSTQQSVTAYRGPLKIDSCAINFYQDGLGFFWFFLLRLHVVTMVGCCLHL